MGRFLQNYPRFIINVVILMIAMNSMTQITHAEVLNIPITRVISTQPISALEIISTLKTIFNGRVLSLKKKSTYTNPDCHHVKFLEDRGEFQLITIGCGLQKMAKS